LVIISHERSGTHFLINSLSGSFNYSARSINLDHTDVNINYYAPENILDIFKKLSNIHIANVIKSHHSSGFFDEILNEILDDFNLLYIYRDPRDVMVSLWKQIQFWEWHEGPKTETLQEFIHSSPSGRMMRYQQHQEPSVLHRWESHVRSWIIDISDSIRNKIIYVKYEELHSNFDVTMETIANQIGINSYSIVRPLPSENVIPPISKGGVGGYREHLKTEDDQYIKSVIGGTMCELGYQ
jgi:hypothetical protein